MGQGSSRRLPQPATRGRAPWRVSRWERGELREARHCQCEWAAWKAARSPTRKSRPAHLAHAGGVSLRAGGGLGNRARGGIRHRLGRRLGLGRRLRLQLGRGHWRHRTSASNTNISAVPELQGTAGKGCTVRSEPGSTQPKGGHQAAARPTAPECSALTCAVGCLDLRPRPLPAAAARLFGVRPRRIAGRRGAGHPGGGPGDGAAVGGGPLPLQRAALARETRRQPAKHVDMCGWKALAPVQARLLTRILQTLPACSCSTSSRTCSPPCRSPHTALRPCPCCRPPRARGRRCAPPR